MPANLSLKSGLWGSVFRPNGGVIALSILALAASAAYQVNAFARSRGVTSGEASGGVNLASPVSVVEERAVPVLELHIANTGFTLLKNARVEMIGRGVMMAEMRWGAQSLRWVVYVPYNTKFIRESGEAGALADIREGDYVTITGELDAAASEPAIEALYIRY